MTKLLTQTFLGFIFLCWSSFLLPFIGSKSYMGILLFLIASLIMLGIRIFNKYKLLGGSISFLIILIGGIFTQRLYTDHHVSFIISSSLFVCALLLLGFEEVIKELIFHWMKEKHIKEND